MHMKKTFVCKDKTVLCLRLTQLLRLLVELLSQLLNTKQTARFTTRGEGSSCLLHRAADLIIQASHYCLFVFLCHLLDVVTAVVLQQK